jgi:hypothetical protein
VKEYGAATPNLMTNLIIKLILFPVLVLLFLLKGVAALFRSDHSAHIPKIVEKLASERAPLGTAIKELTFNQVLAYANRKGAVTVRQTNFFEFEIDVDGKTYHAAITRAPDGSNCAIFRCRPVTDHTVPVVQALARAAPHSIKKNSEAGETSQNEIAELASVVNGLNAIFDKHAEKIKW